MQQLFTFAQKNKFRLENNQELGPVSVVYETYGKLSKQKDNAILFCHSFSGSSHIARHNKEDESKLWPWWDSLIGTKKLFDPKKYFLICSNVLGGCYGTTGPDSINPITGSKYHLSFPIITIRDMVKGQKVLIDHLGIKKLLSVIGGSMGGMQALEWGVTYPKMMKSIVCIGATAKMNALGLAFNEFMRQIILLDSSSLKNLKISRMIGTITFLGLNHLQNQFNRAVIGSQNNLYSQVQSNFLVNDYLNNEGEQFIQRFDPITYLYLLKALDLHDITFGYGSLEKALDRIIAPLLLISISSDWIFTPEEIEKIAIILRNKMQSVRHERIVSEYGHDIFLVDPKTVVLPISQFLYDI